jgi:glycerophosphoryl diester phosphodiesterase
MPGLDWLVARPVAHRGLHDAQRNIIENTPAAFAAAVAARYGIECDLQVSADGEAMVHHDDSLGRLTEASGPLVALTAADLKRVAFKATQDRMLTLGELCELVGGRATLVIELKSRFDGDRRLVRRAAKVLTGYAGPAAVMSFDPTQVAALRATAPGIVRGIVAESRYGGRHWSSLPAATRRAMAYFVHALDTRPQFIAYAVRDLPALVPTMARKFLGLPVLAWTVRCDEERERARRWADQMIFEGFRP